MSEQRRYGTLYTMQLGAHVAVFSIPLMSPPKGLPILTTIMLADESGLATPADFINFDRLIREDTSITPTWLRSLNDERMTRLADFMEKRGYVQ